MQRDKMITDKKKATTALFSLKNNTQHANILRKHKWNFTQTPFGRFSEQQQLDRNDFGMWSAR